MPERKRSKDGRKEADDILTAEGEVAHAGRAGGRLSRQVGTKDELKRATERPAGQTRVTKSMKKEEKDDG